MSMETDQIESEINNSRHRLNDTLSALGQKLSPGQMLDEVLGLAQGQAGEFAAKLGRQVKDNPMPTLLIAAGVGMLLLNRGGEHVGHSASDHDDWHAERRYRALEEARWSTTRGADESDEAWSDRLHKAQAGVLDLTQRAGEAADAFKARVKEAVEAAKIGAENVRARMSAGLGHAKHAAMDQARKLGARASDARHSAEAFYDQSPLAAGAIALAVGAMLGAATPISRQEREALQGVADGALRRGADLVERGAEAAASRMETAVH